MKPASVSWPRAAHHEVPFDLGGIEHMQRSPAVEGDEIGDIDQRIDRAQPDRGEPPLQPFRARAIFHAAHQAQREAAAQWRRRPEIQPHRDRTRTGAIDRLYRRVLQHTHIGGGEVPSDAVDAGAVRPIGRDVDLDDGIIEMGPFGIACT